MMTALIIALVFALMTFAITAFAEGEAADAAADAAAGPSTYATIFSLLPPVIAIALALITKEVYSSLFIGVLAGSVMAASFKPAATMDVMINDGLIAAASGVRT
jgi:hypothetical protein